jgi:hypothetical protein
MIGRTLVFAVVVASLGGARAARADDWATPVAVDLFNEGKQAEARGDYATACSKFAESAKVEVRVGTLARLAQCEERRGLTLAARAHWEQAADLADSQHDPRAEHARQEFARVDAEVPKLKLVLADAPPGLTITLDERHLDASALGTPLPVTAGEHKIGAEAPGKRSFATSVLTTSNGAVTVVAINLGEVPPPASTAESAVLAVAGPLAAPSSAERPPASPHPWSPQKSFALAAGGLGVLAIGIGTYFGLRSFSRWSSAKEQCGVGCGPGDPATVAKGEAQDAATLADIGFGSAGVLLAAATVLWFTASRDVSTPTKSVQIVPLGGPVVGIAALGRLGR